MKKPVFFAMIFILMIVISGCAGLAQESPVGPRMVVKKQVFNSGKVLQGEVIRHSFEVFNKGDQVLEIKRVKPG